MATVIVGCILCSMCESSKNGINCMDLLPAMLVMSCNRFQAAVTYTELKLLVVMRQVLHCIRIPAAPTRHTSSTRLVG